MGDGNGDGDGDGDGGVKVTARPMVLGRCLVRPPMTRGHSRADSGPDHSPDG